MPDKRQTSKQRRAARNRAQRDALAARRQNAGVATTRPAPSSTSASTTGTTSTASGTATAAAGPAARTGKGRRRPGDLALLVALGLSLVAFVLLLNTDIPIDDRGEALPATFGGVAALARAALTDGPVVEDSENIISYYGAGIVALMAVPLVVVAVVFVLSRRAAQRSRLLTFAMLGLAGVVVLTGTFGFYYMPALIALAVASFQVRKVELPARPAQPRPTRAGGRRGAIDVDAVDDDEAEVEPEARPTPSTRSRRSGGRARRPAAAAPVGAESAEVAESYEDGDVYDPETGAKDARPDVVEGDVIEVGDVGGAQPATAEPAGEGPAAGRAAAAGPEASPVAEPVDVEPQPEAAPPVDAGDTSGPEADDILAELEEELRREAEADEDDDPPTRR